MKNIGVFGFAGFIGSNFCEMGSNFNNIIYKLDRFEAGLNNQFQIDKFFNIDTFIWAASNVNPSIAENSPELVNSEIKTWKNFLNFIKDLKDVTKKIRKVIFLSSGGCVYDGSLPPFKVGDSANGINSYGKMKAYMERSLIESGIPYTILRIANAYGAGQPNGKGQGVFAEWNYSLKLNKPLRVFGSTQKVRDYIHVSDIVNAIDKSIKSETNSIFNIGSSQGISLDQIIEIYKTNSKFPIRLEFAGNRELDRKGYWLDIHKTQEILNWNPTIDLESGIKKMLENL